MAKKATPSVPASVVYDPDPPAEPEACVRLLCNGVGMKTFKGRILESGVVEITLLNGNVTTRDDLKQVTPESMDQGWWFPK